MENQLIVTLRVDELKTLITEGVQIAISKIPSPQKEDETILKRKDIARLFSVSLVTVTEWMKSGRLPHYRIKSRVFFKRGEVLKAMEASPKYKRPDGQTRA